MTASKFGRSFGVGLRSPMVQNAGPLLGNVIRQLSDNVRQSENVVRQLSDEARQSGNVVGQLSDNIRQLGNDVCKSSDLQKGQ